MMHLRRGVAVILLLIACAVSAMASVRAVTIPFATKGPVLKGDLSDPLWAKGALLAGFVGLSENQNITQRTQARALYDAHYLYLGIRCAQSNPGGMIRAISERDGLVWADDSIEFLFDTANAHHTVYHIIANSIGTLYDEKCVDVDRTVTGWNSGCRVKSGRVAGAWVLEVAVPFKDFGIVPRPGLTWGLNVCRSRLAGAQEYSSWSPTPGGFVQPKNLGHIVFGDRNGNWGGIRLTSWGNLDPDNSYSGRNVVECFIPNLGHTPLIYDVSLRASVRGKTTLNLRRKVYLTTGEDADVEIPYKPSGSPLETFALNISLDGRSEFKAVHPAMVVPRPPRVWQLKDPLFKELLSKNPPGEQKNGVIYWFHSSDAPGLRNLAKEYGLRYSLDEAYKELIDYRFMPVTMTPTITGDVMTEMHQKYPFKVVLEPDYRPSRDLGVPVMDGLPFILDPRSREVYFKDLRNAISQRREFIYGIYTYDEFTEKTVEQGPEFYAKMKDTYPLMREIDARVRNECGYGKYGMPQAPEDPDPFRWIAYRKWVNRQLLDWQAEVYKTVQEMAPEIKVISMDATAGHKPFDLDRISPYVDIVTHQTYPMANPNLQEVGFVTKFVADLTGKPVWPCAHVENYAYSVTAEEAREMMSQVMRNGGKGFHLYIPDVRGGRASSGDTMLTKYGCPERYRMITEIVKTAERMNEVAIPTDPDCAVLYSEDHYQSFPATNYVFPNEPLYLHTFLGPVARTWFKFVNDNMIADGKGDLSKYKAVFVPAAKYERRDVVEKLIDYVEGGGVLVLSSPDCFSFAPDGSPLDDLRRKLIGASSASGNPSIIRNRLGKGKVLTFASNPFTSANVGDPKWKSRFTALAKGLGLKTGRDIWRFKFPEFKGVYQPDPAGICLTGNFIKWHQERPLDICNVTTKGTYSYSVAPDGIADRGDASGVGFDTGKLTDRKRAPSVLRTQLKPDDFIVTWKSVNPVDITFDLADSYGVNQAHLWYSGQLPAITVEGSTDGQTWTRLAASPKQQPTQDVLDLALNWKQSREFRFIRLSFGERDPVLEMTLAECEIWADSTK